MSRQIRLTQESLGKVASRGGKCMHLGCDWPKTDRPSHFLGWASRMRNSIKPKWLIVEALEFLGNEERWRRREREEDTKKKKKLKNYDTTPLHVWLGSSSCLPPPPLWALLMCVSLFNLTKKSEKKSTFYIKYYPQFVGFYRGLTFGETVETPHSHGLRPICCGRMRHGEHHLFDPTLHPNVTQKHRHHRVGLTYTSTY